MSKVKTNGLWRNQLTDAERQEWLQDHSVPEPNTGCWLWTERVSRFGYGMIYTRREKSGSRYIHAHRASYEAFVGPIPEGHDICHSCDTPGCISPRHLRPGTDSENISEMYQKRRNTRMRMLTAFGETRSLSEWARKYGLRIRTIGLRLEKNWPIELAVSLPADRVANRGIRRSA